MTEAEKERLNYCPRTVSNKHIWQATVIGQKDKEFTEEQYKAGALIQIKIDIIKPKCLACKIVDDVS